ncbi:MAG TPA: nucleotide exchange factor GrpE [Armatimonadetes bacterium]|nr:nucleotide exchange factor GrpE [Armatimonadota bacterium]
MVSEKNERAAASPDSLSAAVQELLANPEGERYQALLRAVEAGAPPAEELATSLLQVASALVQTVQQQGTTAALRERWEQQRRQWEELAAARRNLRQREEDLRAETEERLARRLFAAAAPAAVQLPTLRWRMERGRRVLRRELLAVATVLAEALAVVGLEPLGQVGETVAYDPRRHLPARPRAAGFSPGDPVVVHTVGYTYRGRVLRPAQVDTPPSGRREEIKG